MAPANDPACPCIQGNYTSSSRLEPSIALFLAGQDGLFVLGIDLPVLGLKHIKCCRCPSCVGLLGHRIHLLALPVVLWLLPAYQGSLG